MGYFYENISLRAVYMKKLSFRLSLVALSFCFIPQGGHAMDDTAPSGDEFHKGGTKRLRETDPEMPDPSMPLENDQPFSTSDFTLYNFQEVLLPKTSYTSGGKIIWAHRLVCKAWKSMLGLIKTVDLSHEYIVPLAKRVELMNADKQYFK